MSTRPYHRHVFDANIIREAIKTVESWRALALKLGIPYPSSVVYHRLRPFCRDHDIDFSHFLGSAINRGKEFPDKRTDINEYLDGTRYIRTHPLKQKLIKEGIKEHRCEKCKHTEWNGAPIPITLHHVDGNSANNNLINLQILCPNCHAQTDNFCGKNQERVKGYVTTPNEAFLEQIPLWTCPAQVLRALGLTLAKPHYDKIRKLMKDNLTIQFRPKEIKPVKDGYHRTTSGGVKKKGDPEWRTKPKPERRKVVRPSKEELEKLVWQLPMLKLGQTYGVTDGAVRKWCDYYGITNLPPIRYWARRNAGWSHAEALAPIHPKQVQKRLTDNQVLEILGLLKANELYQREIARQYDVCHTVIISIKQGKTYKHVPRN